jgi:hypothetical protein
VIIGISGLANSGKDTVADILALRRACAKVSFADPLKRICRDVFQFTDEQLWGPSASRNAPDFRYMVSEGYAEAYEKHKETDPELAANYARQGYLTPRVALQLLGTEWGRRCYDTIWVDYALRVAKTILTDQRSYSAAFGLGWGANGYQSRRAVGVVIPDVRFKNEVKGIKAAGGKLIRVVRPGSGLKGTTGQHQSETEQTEIPDEMFDFVIHNVGTLEALEQCVLRAWIGLATGSWPAPGELEEQAAAGITPDMLMGHSKA